MLKKPFYSALNQNLRAMSNSEDVQSDLSVIQEGDVEDKTFKCCQTKSNKTLVCIACGNSYHLSCAIKNKLKCIKICDTRLICCETNKSDTDNLTKIENKMLKKLLEEKEDKYKLLMDNNKLLQSNNNLLQEKIDLLETRLKKNSEKRETNADKTIASEQLKKPYKKDKQTNSSQMGNSVNNKNSYVSDTNFEAQNQINKMNEIINLVNIPDTSLNNSELGTRKEEEFKLVQNRRKKNNKKIVKRIGEKENEDDFGAERRVWLYLYRIRRHITSEKIYDYVKNQETFKHAEIIVKELPTEENRNKCFMFGISECYKEEIYRQSTWPKSIGFKRFNFTKYNNYLRSNKDF